jgi:hypothetical protein
MDYNKMKAAMQTVTIKDVKVMYDMANDRQRELNEEATRTYRCGDEVTFKGRRGVMLVGKITKINRKTVVVECHSDQGGCSYPQVWKCHPTSLTRI